MQEDNLSHKTEDQKEDTKLSAPLGKDKDPIPPVPLPPKGDKPLPPTPLPPYSFLQDKDEPLPPAPTPLPPPPNKGDKPPAAPLYPYISPYSFVSTEQKNKPRVKRKVLFTLLIVLMIVTGIILILFTIFH